MPYGLTSHSKLPVMLLFCHSNWRNVLICALDGNQAGCAVRYVSEIQPTFSLWHRRLLPRLEEAVLEQGMAGFKQFLQDIPAATLDWETSDLSPFFNINDPDALVEAARLLDRA